MNKNSTISTAVAFSLMFSIFFCFQRRVYFRLSSRKENSLETNRCYPSGLLFRTVPWRGRNSVPSFERGEAYKFHRNVWISKQIVYKLRCWYMICLIDVGNLTRRKYAWGRSVPQKFYIGFPRGTALFVCSFSTSRLVWRLGPARIS